MYEIAIGRRKIRGANAWVTSFQFSRSLSSLNGFNFFQYFPPTTLCSQVSVLPGTALLCSTAFDCVRVARLLLNAHQSNGPKTVTNERLEQIIRDTTIPCTDNGVVFTNTARLDFIQNTLSTSNYSCFAEPPLARLYKHKGFRDFFGID